MEGTGRRSEGEAEGRGGKQKRQKRGKKKENRK